MADESPYDAAANALAEAANPGGSDPYGGGQGLTTPQANQPEQGTPVDPNAPVDTGPASREIDISQLPEEARLYLQAREREMTGDYTRKQQELAQQRQEADQAIQFYTALNSDPQFAAQVYEQLQTALSQTGFLQAPYENTETDEWGNPVETDPYQAELEQIKGWMAQQEAQQQYFVAEAHLNNQIATIRSQHPDYSDDDIGNILSLGYATGGDLMAANQQYQLLTQNTIERYMQTKGGVNTPAALPNNTGQTPSAPPRGDKELRAAALERMRNELGA